MSHVEDGPLLPPYICDLWTPTPSFFSVINDRWTLHAICQDTFTPYNFTSKLTSHNKSLVCTINEYN